MSAPLCASWKLQTWCVIALLTLGHLNMNVLVHACGWVEKKYLYWWYNAKICGTLRQEQGGKGEPFRGADGTLS